MYARYFEDIRIGEQATLGTHRFEADAIKAFARKFDPQPFHLDEEAGRASHFGGLCASGWHTAAACQRVAVTFREHLVEDMRSAGRDDIAELGPSPGFRNLKWLRPVYAGDTLTFTNRILNKTEMRSHPAWGLVHSLVEGSSQDGRPAFAYNAELYLQRRPR